MVECFNILQAYSSKQQCTRISFQFPTLHGLLCAMQYFISGELTWDIRSLGLRRRAHGLPIAHKNVKRWAPVWLLAWLDAISESQSAQVYIGAPGNKLISLLQEELNTTIVKVFNIESLKDSQKFNLRHLVSKQTFVFIRFQIYSPPNVTLRKKRTGFDG